MSSESPHTRDSAEALSTRLCGPADRAEQAGLYETCFGTTDGERTLRWRYDENPAGMAVSLLTSEGERAISGYACQPRRTLSHGDEASLAAVGETGDVMTHPDARGRGVFSELDRRAMEETARQEWPVVFGLPNARSAHIFTGKLGWKEVGAIRPWTFVLAADERAREQRMRAGRLAALATPWAAWRGTMRRGKLRNRAWEKVNTVAIARFDQDVDEISRGVEHGYSWMARRDAAFLNWRFLDAPSGLFRAHGVYEPGGGLVGYVVVQLPRRGEAVGFVVDLLARDDVAFAAAMDAALGHLAKSSAAVARATAIEGSWWERQLRSSGFRAPKAEDKKIIIAYVHDQEHPLGRAALDPSGWYFTDADRDDETVG